MIDQIFSYREMCDRENVQVLQRGMNYRLNPKYSVILMSRRSNAPYHDRILADGTSVEYEGHDESKTENTPFPKRYDQPLRTKSGRLTQNGLFANAADQFKNDARLPEKVRVYEKVLPGVWSLKGLFDLVDYSIKSDGIRNVIIFRLDLSDQQEMDLDLGSADETHNRLIPSEVKLEVWKRDKGVCVICGSEKNLHFDHDLPFSRGGTSLSSKNIRILCAKHNLSKSDKIE